MKEFFVIGNQTSNSLSPLIFNHWFKKYKIKARYSYVEVDDIRFDTTLTKKLENKNTTGFNVTIPYKKRIFKHLKTKNCLLYTSPSPRDKRQSRMPSSA